ncbi:cytochrome P450 [soil metagenome]
MSVTIDPEEFSDFELHFSETLLAVLVGLQRKHGDIIKFFSTSRKNYTIILASPAAVRHVLQLNNRNYSKGAGIDQVKMLLGNGIMVSEGNFWKQQRRMIQPSFHKEGIASILKIMETLNESLLKKLKSAIDKKVAVNVNALMSEVTLEIVLRSIFSDDLKKIKDPSGENPFDMLTKEVGRDLRFAMKFRSLRKFVIQLVNERKATNRWPHDFLSMLAQSTNKQTGLEMNEIELVDEVMTLIVAGHETTASALTWAWYMLAKNPVATEKLKEEAITILGGGHPTMETISSLKYSRMVVDEVLRLYPPGWLITRKALQNDTIEDMEIPAGSDVLISPYLIHRNSSYWIDPEEFDPERFREDSRKLIDRFNFIPFSSGPRQCIGDTFALIEMQVHLSTIIQHFSVELTEENVVGLDAGINLRPDRPIMMRFCHS